MRSTHSQCCGLLSLLYPWWIARQLLGSSRFQSQWLSSCPFCDRLGALSCSRTPIRSKFRFLDLGLLGNLDLGEFTFLECLSGADSLIVSSFGAKLQLLTSSPRFWVSHSVYCQSFDVVYWIGESSRKPGHAILDFLTDQKHFYCILHGLYSVSYSPS